jgi:peptidoglycan hydrolase-like protein with peptidoglycan-binding domain
VKDAAGHWVGLGLGDVDPKVALIKQKLRDKYQWARDWKPPLVVDNTYDPALATAVAEFQRRVGLPQTGIMNAASQNRLGVAVNPSPPPPAYRPIWFYSAPGSGASWWVGPSFDTGQWCKDVLHINHQPIGFPMGGYMGLMGGDPSLSYNEVIAAEGAELERLLDTNPDINNPDVEFWFSGYSQSADGMEDALVRLFGDGGKYAHLRSRINGTLMFGNPSRQPGPTKVGNNPVGWGISRKVRPDWLKALTWSITAETPGAPDFYACCDDEIRPLFYAEIVQAETSLPFFVHVMKIALPVVAHLPFIGALLAPVMALASPLMGLINGPDEPVDQKLEQLLSVQGVLTNLPALFHLLGALPGIATHGSYYDPKPEFGGRTGIQVACDAVASFRR